MSGHLDRKINEHTSALRNERVFLRLPVPLGGEGLPHGIKDRIQLARAQDIGAEAP